MAANCNALRYTAHSPDRCLEPRQQPDRRPRAAAPLSPGGARTSRGCILGWKGRPAPWRRLWSVKDQACPAHARCPSMAAQLAPGTCLFCPPPITPSFCLPALVSRYGARRWLGASVAGSARAACLSSLARWHALAASGHKRARELATQMSRCVSPTVRGYEWDSTIGWRSKLAHGTGAGSGWPAVRLWLCWSRDRDAHDNVARWLKTHPGHTAVRGWRHSDWDAFRGHQSWMLASSGWMLRRASGGMISTFCGGLAPMPRTGGSLRKWRGADY